MELLSDEMKHVTALVEDWNKSTEAELEATFGLRGIVDVQTFLNVVARLRSKGFKPIPQEDRLTVSLPDGVRFTITGGNVVEDYCRDNNMATKDFIAIIKNRTATTSSVKDTLDINDYDLRIKSRRETPLAKNDKLVTDALVKWAAIPKYFRLIRRWTFKDEKKNIRFDLSMVRSTPSGTQRTFQEKNIVNSRPVYEIEVELERGFSEDTPVPTIRNQFLQGIGEILRGIQGSPILIRKKDKLKVLEEYTKLSGTNKFRGNKLMPLMKKNMVKDIDTGIPNIRNEYNVTDKADGLRVLGFVNEEGKLYMIDMAMNVYNTGLSNKLCRNSLVDGEYVTKDDNGKGIQELLLFDIWYAPEADYVGDKPFKSDRYPNLRRWIEGWKRDGPTKDIASTKLDVKIKTYFFPSDKLTIFDCANIILTNKQTRNYYTDGLIFTPNTLPLPDRPEATFEEQFKWKPSMDNTVDFLVQTEKDPENRTKDKLTFGKHPGTGEALFYKTLRLYVGSRDPPDPRSIILNQLPLTSEMLQEKYRPVLFNPSEFADTMANVCNLKTHTDPETNEIYVATEPVEHGSDDTAKLGPIAGTPIRDKSIVEMRYDPTQPPGWRWVPIRVRADKMERLMRGEIAGSLNSLVTANGVWESIHDPITKSMITSGSEVPSKEDLEILQAALPSLAITKRYYERKAQKHDLRIVKGLRDFHNLYIKEELLYGAIFSKSNVKLLDLTVGRAGDLGRWVRGKADFVLGVDAAGANITDSNDGAYARLLKMKINQLKRRSKENIPPMFFVIADSSQNLLNGDAGQSPEEKDILRSILGRYEPEAALPSLVANVGAGALQSGADAIVCMFALHYFFETESKFNGFLKNISDNLKVGGYFAGTNFDGQKVFELLQKAGIEKGKSYVGMEKDTPLWEITKEYDANELPIDETGFGLAIDVEFISIGSKHREYLVPWELFVAKMKSIGCELVPADELKELGLRKSTNLFEESYRMATEKAPKKFPMNDTVKQFSFLNRWYIFKRTSEGIAEGNVDIATLAKQVVAPPVLAEMTNEERVALTAASAAVRTAVVDDTMMPSMVRPGSLAAAEAAKAAAIPKDESVVVAAPTTIAPVAAAAPSGVGALAVQEERMKYVPAKFIRFNESSVEKEAKLKLPTKYASYALRYLSPGGQFPIRDTTDPSDTKIYPSITHFLAGMMMKYASKKPDLGWTTFSQEGTIHIQYEGLKKASGQLTKVKEFEFMRQEADTVESKLKEELIKSNTKFDTTLWNVKKKELLEAAIKQRFARDKWFCVIVDAAVTGGKYLVYEKPNSELGATIDKASMIQGPNVYGKTIMQLATSDPEVLKSCLQLPDPM